MRSTQRAFEAVAFQWNPFFSRFQGFTKGCFKDEVNHWMTSTKSVCFLKHIFCSVSCRSVTTVWVQAGLWRRSLLVSVFLWRNPAKTKLWLWIYVSAGFKNTSVCSDTLTPSSKVSLKRSDPCRCQIFTPTLKPLNVSGPKHTCWSAAALWTVRTSQLVGFPSPESNLNAEQQYLVLMFLTREQQVRSHLSKHAFYVFLFMSFCLK